MAARAWLAGYHFSMPPHAPLDVSAQPVPLVADGEGVVRISGSRVTLDTVVGAFEDGATAEEIVQRYPTLRLAQVYSVIAYYLEHRAEVADYLARRVRARQDVQRDMESSWPREGVRERLIERQARRKP